MTLPAVFSHLACMFVHLGMTFDAFMWGRLQIVHVGGDLMTRLAGHIEVSALEGKKGLLMIEAGADTERTVVTT
jgi:hypothetical protein